MIKYKPVHFGNNIRMMYAVSDAGFKLRKVGSDEEPFEEILYPIDEGIPLEETDIPVNALKEEASGVVENIFGTYITAERAAELAPIILEAVESLQSDEEASATPELYQEWSGDGVSYEVGKRVRRNGILYKVLQAHTSQDDWAPDVAVSLFAEILVERDEDGEQTVIPVWVQPDSTNGYMTGDKVHFPTMDDPIYESLIDNNVWDPASYPAGWKIVPEE